MIKQIIASVALLGVVACSNSVDAPVDAPVPPAPEPAPAPVETPTPVAPEEPTVAVQQAQ